MNNTGNTKDFLRFITNPLTINAIELIYKNHNVVYERVDLYRSFTLSLNTLIQTTYLGDDITSPHAQKQHFDWCWRKTSNDFESYGVYFMDNQELYIYFLGFFRKTFYEINDKETAEGPKNIELVFLYLLDYNQIKKSSDIDTFIDIYKKFDLTLKIK